MLRDVVRHGNGTIIVWNKESDRELRMAGHRGKWRAGLRNLMDSMWEYGPDAYKG